MSLVVRFPPPQKKNIKKNPPAPREGAILKNKRKEGRVTLSSENPRNQIPLDVNFDKNALLQN